jgi:PII-like signaling protein
MAVQVQGQEQKTDTEQIFRALEEIPITVNIRDKD